MKKTKAILIIILAIFSTASLVFPCCAQPYGKGLYNENIPYGDQTSLSISTSGNVNIPITPTTTGVFSTGSNSVTVTSTDVKGYKLYIRALKNTYMDNLGAQLPASSNASPAALTMDTWGYNLDASTNFVGINSTDTLIKSASAPTPNGDSATITYGIKLDMAKPAGNYTANVVYTAVPQTN